MFEMKSWKKKIQSRPSEIIGQYNSFQTIAPISILKFMVC